MKIPTVDEQWQDLQTFKHRGLLAMKNLDNNLPTESWDAMYFTGLYIMTAALRLKRTGDAKVRDEIADTLATIVKYGPLTRGFNSEGEYWRGFSMTKYKPIWGDKEIFGDTSRDQLISLIFGLYFLDYALDWTKYPELYKQVLEIVRQLREELEPKDYDIGTTYGDCKSFSMAFSLLLHKLDPSTPIQVLKPAQQYLRWVPGALGLVNFTMQYFNYELTTMLLVLVINCFDDSVPEKWLTHAKKGFKRMMKKRVKDHNLFFELLYFMSTGEYMIPRDFRAELDDIFTKTHTPKLQDFIWQRCVLERYKPHDKNQEKNFEGPWMDYLAVYELMEDLGL